MRSSFPRYPSASATMQFGAYHDERGGIYFAAEDPHAQTKIFSMSGKRGQLFASWQWLVGNNGQGGNGFLSSGEAAIEAFDGDWFDAGQIYKRWLSREAPWFPKLPRTDTPAWYRESTVWVSDWNREVISKVVPALQQYMGLPVGVRWYAWMEHYSHDQWYPNFVAYDGFVQTVQELQAKGIRVKPYMNYRIWDQKARNKTEADEYAKVGLPSAVKDRSGNIYGSSEKFRRSGKKQLWEKDEKFSLSCVWSERIPAFADAV